MDALDRSAARIAKTLDHLAALDHARDPVTVQTRRPDPSDPLARPITFHWDRPVDAGFRGVCALLGCRLIEQGERRAAPAIVSVHEEGASACEVLQDMDWQAGADVAVPVDRARREIELACGVRQANAPRGEGH